MALIIQHGLQCFHYGHQLQATQQSPFHKGGSWSPPLYINPKGHNLWDNDWSSTLGHHDLHSNS